MALSESENLAHAQRAVPCNVCENEVPGEYYCIECKQTLCHQCEKNHKRIAGTRNHNIVQRTQVGDINTTTLTCTDHEDQASCHCEKCNIPLCTKCVTGKHKGHTMSDLGDVLEEEKRKFQRDIKAMQKAVLALKSQRDELITEKEIYKKKIKKILNDMEDEIQAVMTEITKIHNERKSGKLSIQDSQLELFAGFEEEMKRNIILYEKRISEYEDTIKKNTF